VFELDARSGRKIGARPSAIDQRRQARYVVGLHMRLKDRHDRRSDRRRRRQVVVDKVGMRVDHRELVVAGAAEQVARA
jgi:hypothetical protein